MLFVLRKEIIISLRKKTSDKKDIIILVTVVADHLLSHITYLKS